MKSVSTCAAFVLLFALCGLQSSSALVTGQVTHGQQDRTITKVIKLLQGLLDKSKAEGDEERTIYAKFKCYCDTSEAEKVASIEQLTKEIELLESKIEGIKARTGELSEQVAQLDADMEANAAAQTDATNVRGQEQGDFEALRDDLNGAITQLTDAINVLAEVNADQSPDLVPGQPPKEGAADHKYFMSGYTPPAAAGASLLKLKSQLRSALTAASALVGSGEAQRKVAAFIEAPFTGTYTSQSVEVMGILKDMKDTFSANLADAIAKNEASIKAYNEFMQEKQAQYTIMETAYNKKMGELSSNDNTLSNLRIELGEAEAQKASDEEFLSKLRPLCAEKAKGYQDRLLLRKQEEAALAEAIAILNSDAAFETFGTTDAATTGALEETRFLQLKSVSRHQAAAVTEKSTRGLLEKLLRESLAQHKSHRISKVLTMVDAENPFAVVLEEISKMITLINEEAAMDEKDLAWCIKERRTSKANVRTANSQIKSLEDDIFQLTVLIDDPDTGLKASIETTENDLKANHESMVQETAERTDSNLAYQKDIANLVEAETLLKRAIKVLRKYYDALAEKLAADAGAAALLQEDPAPPEAWKGDGAYTGQSTKATDAIGMLEFILKNTEAEEQTAHSDENTAQVSFEDSMTFMKKEEARMNGELATLKKQLAEAEQQKLEKEEEYEATVKERDAILAYLLKIKPGCDFITMNKDARDTARAEELRALNKATELIKGTPAYEAALDAARVEGYGQCKDKCVDDDEQVVCKACLAKVSIPGYCAGHPGTPGCDQAQVFSSTPVP